MYEKSFIIYENHFVMKDFLKSTIYDMLQQQVVGHHKTICPRFSLQPLVPPRISVLNPLQQLLLFISSPPSVYRWLGQSVWLIKRPLVKILRNLDQNQREKLSIISIKFVCNFDINIDNKQILRITVIICYRRLQFKN